jgi:hypothetical protein
VPDSAAGTDQHRLESHRPTPDDQAGGHQQDAVEDPEQAEQLGDHHQVADRDDAVCQDGRRARPARKRRASRRPSGNRHRQDDRE